MRLRNSQTKIGIKIQKTERVYNMSTIEKTFSNGEIIIKEGDSGNTFYQLLEGNVAVYKNYEEKDQVVVATLGAGQYFGEMAVIEGYPRSTTIVAEGDVKVLEIAAEELNDYISENPDKILAIMKLLGSRIKTMTDDYNEAKKTLDQVRRTDSKINYDSFFSNMMQNSIYLTAKNFRLEHPSAEALREAAAAVSRSNTDNAETYKYGTIIFKQGEIGKCMYILHEGNVCVYKNYGEKDELKLTSVDPVACFGEIGMLLEEPRNATAAVETSGTQIEVIYPEDLADLFKTNPERIDMIMKNLSYRLRRITYEYCEACQEIAEAQESSKFRR